MCGFAGFVNPKASTEAAVLATTAERMCRAIAHRGPDDSGVWVDASSGIALGHRRLSIIDLTQSGHQPMASASGRYVIAYNGEIYNYEQIRREIEKELGKMHWRGHSDTEVALAAVELWGLDGALNRFNGMFAFVLWDTKEKVINLARDRVGEKPLYYGGSGGVFFFGSELKAFKSHPDFQSKIDRGALALFMRHNYVPAPYSIYEGIYKLPPGCALTLKAESLRDLNSFSPFPRDEKSASQPYRYWSALKVCELGAIDPSGSTPKEAEDELEKLLLDAVSTRMVSDVPLGAFLSGGVDSSMVVALMQSQSLRPVKTFSIGFHEDGYNEAVYARAVANHIGSDHTELYVSASEAMAAIPLLPTLYDEPFADSSQIPTYLVSKLARRDVTVALSGDGGDEIFGGYTRYFTAGDIWKRIAFLPLFARNSAAKTLNYFSPSAWDSFYSALEPLLPAKLRFSNPGHKFHKLAKIISSSGPEEIYIRLVSHWDEPLSIVRSDYEPSTPLTDSRLWPKDVDFSSRMMYLDLVTYLPDDILVKVDRASMGVSLEARVPFLDHRIIEFASRLPLSMKIGKNEGKVILRKLLYKYVPKDLIDRPKMGFGVPIDSWLRGPLKEWAGDYLSASHLSRGDFFRPEPLIKAWDEHLSGGFNRQYMLWNVLMFESWLERNS